MSSRSRRAHGRSGKSQQRKISFIGTKQDRLTEFQTLEGLTSFRVTVVYLKKKFTLQSRTMQHSLITVMWGEQKKIGMCGPFCCQIIVTCDNWLSPAGFLFHVLITTTLLWKRKAQQTKNCNQCKQWSAGKRIIYGLITAPACICCSERHQHASSSREEAQYQLQFKVQIDNLSSSICQRVIEIFLKLHLPVILHQCCLFSDGRQVNISFGDVRQSR